MTSLLGQWALPVYLKACVHGCVAGLLTQFEGQTRGKKEMAAYPRCLSVHCAHKQVAFRDSILLMVFWHLGMAQA